MLAAQIKHKIKSYLPKPMVEALASLRRFATKKIPDSHVYVRHVAGKKGIEIGGPSTLFKTTLPLYQEIQDLDGVNFSTNTVWEGKIQAGPYFNFIGNRKGVQFISDTTDLSQIKDNAYDFLLSSNCLEHIANPLRALMEWKRVIKTSGSLILVVPNKDSNFDHKRPVTSFDHILEDFNNNTTEHDLTHLDEILSLHDLSMDPPAGNLESFRKRSLENYKNRTLHHHVFDLGVLKTMLEYCGFDVIQSTRTDQDFLTLSIKKAEPTSSWSMSRTR